MKRLIRINLISILALMLVGCDANSDEALQQQAEQIISAYPNASVEVKDGVLTLKGNFDTSKDKAEALQKLNKIKDTQTVKDEAASLEDLIKDTSISPEDLQKVIDLAKDFPSIQVEVVDGKLTLTGKASSTQDKIIRRSLPTLDIDYNYTVQ